MTKRAPLQMSVKKGNYLLPSFVLPHEKKKSSAAETSSIRYVLNIENNGDEFIKTVERLL